jgi:hypothetical protein
MFVQVYYKILNAIKKSFRKGLMQHQSLNPLNLEQLAVEANGESRSFKNCKQPSYNLWKLVMRKCKLSRQCKRKLKTNLDN